MTDTWDWHDEPLDARLRDLAREYHRPSGEVPREAMWQAIAPAVRAAAQPPGAAADVTPSIARRRRTIAPYAWGAALAAGLVLGIMLEREVLAPHLGSTVASRSPVTDTEHVASSMPIPTSGATVTTAVPSATTQVASAQVGARHGATANPRGGRRDVSSTATIDPATADRTSTTGNGANAQQLYRLAARQTLVQAEALLTAYRANDGQQRDQETMQQAGRWARDVLTSTRLLLDSPAARDPQMRALFTDLELVLAQIVQLSGAPLQAGERELIERAMRDRDLLPRLRSAVPAGATTE
jgi:hypothetical protein